MASTDHPAAPDLSDIPGLGYEQAREELVQVVSRLETGGTSLEESLALWERGEALATRCEQWLDGARERLDAARARRADTDGDGEEEGAGRG
ncbi:exodeoxyribonuclease VII small subunit [Kocuria sp. CPCC 205292]|uniref:Exodeoxyribonuclease 7 small subunit n=1 Tax=Kocuria rosea subsp. polaris TaxID=136273 RepID=A0A0W8IQJ9_KOCRO|nr:exodeoxyribonuclease VII small subunit [Kocuria polaris]KUG62228.1 exodeoxyribonuclease VII small subunit [Kocuria polaris]